MSKKNKSPEDIARKKARSRQVHGGAHRASSFKGPSQADIERGQLSSLLDQVAKHSLHDVVKDIAGLSKGMTARFCADAQSVDAKSRAKLLAVSDKITARIPQQN